MRTLTTNTNTKANTALGTEPIILVKVEWGGSIGTRYYSERYLVFGSITARACILDIGSLNTRMRQNNVGMMTSINLKLDDSSGEFKSIYDAVNIERTSATVYQHFDGNSEADLTPLFQGAVTGPVSWSEGERTFEMSIESKFLQQEIGFAPDFASQALANYYVGLDDSCIGKPWPFVIGTCHKVPAVRFQKAPETSIVTQVGNAFLLEDTTFFGSGLMTLLIDGILFEGQLSGSTFNVNPSPNTGANKPGFMGITIGARDISDPDYGDPSVAWLTNYASLIGQCVHFNFGTVLTIDGAGNPATLAYNTVFRVVKQNGKKLTFDRPVYFGSGTANVLSSGVIVAASKEPQIGYPSPFDNQGSRNFRSVREGGIITGYIWSYGAGTRVQRIDGQSEKYVCNVGGTNQIYGVYASRHGRMELVPSNYWIPQSETIFGKACTTITFPQPLDTYQDQGWDAGKVAVTLKGTISSDPVTAIQAIINGYTSLTPDSTSFTAAAGKGIGTFNFAFASVRNAIQLAELLAYQAGLGLLVEGNTVKVVVLYLEPTSVMTIAEAKVKAGSLSVGLTDLNDVYTKLRGTYKQDYNDKSFEVTLTQNTSRYGLIPQTTDFFAFQTYEEVYESTFFWLNRYSNVWKTIKFTTMMPGILLEVFDCITLNFADGTLLGAIFAPTKAIVTGASYSPKTKEVTIEAMLPCVAGSLAKNGQYWLNGISFPTPTFPPILSLIGATTVGVETVDFDALLDADKGTNDVLPAIITQSLGIGDFIVDVYGDGFTDANGVSLTPTLMSIPAALVDARSSPAPGQYVTVTFTNGQALIQTASSAAASIIAKLSGYNSSTHFYTFDEWDPVTSAKKTNGIVNGQAKELNDSPNITNGTIVVCLNASSQWFFFFPVSTCT